MNDMTIHSVTVAADVAKYLADVALSACSTDDVTPVICAGLFEVDEAGIRVIATDRYRVHTALAAYKDATEVTSMLIPRRALQWLSKNAKAFSSSWAQSTVTLRKTTAPGGTSVVTMTVREFSDDGIGGRKLSYTDDLTRGKFPPVARLIETAREAAPGAPARLNLDFLSKARTLSTDRFSPPPVVKYTGGETTAEGLTAKPGPALIDFTHDGEIYATALIQPYFDIAVVSRG